MLDSSEKGERGVGEQKKEVKVGEQCFICDAPAVFNCPACSQVPICEHHQDYHQANPISHLQQSMSETVTLQWVRKDTQMLIYR